MNTKDEYKDWIKEDTELTQDYMSKIDKQFSKLLKNPNDSDTFDAIIAAYLTLWIKDLTKKLKQQMRNASSIGINVARQQLKAKNITKIVKKALDNKKIKDGINANIKLLEKDLAYVSNSVSSNATRAISAIKNNVLETKKELSQDLEKAFSDYGITYYTDRAGRRHSVVDYINMKSLDVIVGAMRDSYFKTAIRYGVDLVRILHLNIHPHCPLCEPFEDKILSITGKTEGYTTVSEAVDYGLFHFNCDHIPEALELAPDDKGSDGNIELSKENKKRKKYNKNKSFKLFNF